MEVEKEYTAEDLQELDLNNPSVQQTSLKRFTAGSTLQKKSVGMFLNKGELLNKPTAFKFIDPVADTDNFDNPYICIEIEGKPFNLGVSETNINQFIEELGGNYINWKDKEGVVVGKEWEGEIKNEQTGLIERRKGVTLEFTFGKPTVPS